MPNPRPLPRPAALVGGMGAVALLASLAVAAPAGAAPGPRVLLTNDDGIAAPGLTAVRDRLCRSGYRVTVVAPAGNQSGSGGRITSGGTLAVTRSTFRCGSRSDAVAWAVDGSPADTVLVALDRLYDKRAPDLVVSGSNAGQNLSGAVNHSGTVGAALTAAENGIPAVAVSTGIDPAQAAEGFPATTGAYGPTAGRLVRVLDRLERTRRGGRLLPRGVTLNVNHPVVVGAGGRHDDAKVRGIRLTRQWRGAALRPTYVPQADGSLALDAASVLVAAKGAPAGTDDALFADRWMTVTPIQGGAADASARDRRSLARRLRPVLGR